MKEARIEQDPDTNIPDNQACTIAARVQSWGHIGWACYLILSHHPDNGSLLRGGGSADDDRPALGPQLCQQQLLGGAQHMLQSLAINHQLTCAGGAR